ncbi:unnamed protein product [Cunninghamella blakesleeana]
MTTTTTTTTNTKRLTGSMDLLSYYDLLPCYHKYINQTLDPTLFPFVADLPGKTTVEADDYMKQLLYDPHIEETPSQPIKPLDMDTLKEAYHFKDGPIPGFDPSLIFNEDSETTGNHPNQYVASLDKEMNGISSDGERKHKKKKKKRKHKHEHDDDGHGDHKKKKKKKKEREHRDEIEGDNVIVD